MITLNDFKKCEIKIGEIKLAEHAEGTGKLLRLVVDFGSEERQIITAMAEYFPDPKILEGKQMPFLTNLEPRKFKGFESQGMVMTADSDSKPIFLVPEAKIPNGSLII